MNNIKKYGQFINEGFPASDTTVTINIPLNIVALMNDMGVAKDKHGEMFEDYIKHKLGIDGGDAYSEFERWCDSYNASSYYILDNEYDETKD